MEQYVPLHVHSAFGSVGDSVLRIPEFAARAKEYGCPAAAITDHGSMASFVNFYEECQSKGIKPIIGCEFYLADDRLDRESKERAHLILLAKNFQGLQNLIKIHNDASENGFYYKPRTDISVINQYSEGLICLTACVSGPLAKAYKKHDFKKLLTLFLCLRSVFEDDLYLEIQPGHFQEQINYNDLLVMLHEDYGVPLVATNDIHYLDKDDAHAHNWHVKDSRKDVGSINSFVYPDVCYYLMKREELAESFIKTQKLTKAVVDKSIENTLEISAKCDPYILKNILNERIMPVWDSSVDEDKVLSQLCFDSFTAHKLFEKPNGKSYLDRLSNELGTIRQLGFSGYFLIVKDIIDYCDKHDIPRGPGRGSCAGSLVSYLLGISVADPIKYGLMFERFLSVKRKALPDVDLDIAPSRKQEVYDYIIKRYGKEHCCFVSTFNMRKARNAVKTACRLLGIKPKEANIISASIPEVAYDEAGEKQSNISVAEAYESIAGFKYHCDNHDKLFEVASAIEGYPSSVGIHPAGIVISPVNVKDRYPLVRVRDPKTKDWRPIMAASLDLHDVEKLSGVKFDLLSLSSLDVIYKTMSDAGVVFDFSDETLLEDKNVWKLISSEYNAGLFQISSNTYKVRMPQLHPASIQDLAACLALVRGPCISSGMDKVYMDILNNISEEEHIHPVYWEATKETHGVLIFQEQILKICTNIGFDAETAYDILKAVSKKKLDKIRSYETDFYAHGKAKSIPEDILDNIWKKILDSGLYAFNVAHATSYALVCYLSAWLKYYYTEYYMCNLLTKEAEQNNKPEVLLNILNECRALGLTFLPPDINKSGWNFSVEGDKIRIGFSAVKGMGMSVYTAVKAAGEIKDFDDFVKRVSGRVVNKKPILILIAAGAFASVSNLANDELAKYYMEEYRHEPEIWDGNISIGTNQTVNIFADSAEAISTKLFGSRLFIA